MFPITTLPLAFLFTTWWSALAVAAAAAAVPIIIHLLNRKRFRVVTWAAMRFLLAAQKQNVRRMRLEQIILLAVRTLVIVLVVGAMASVTGWAESLWKFVGLKGTGQRLVAHGRTHKIIVVDGSYSMAVKKPKDKQTCFERARARAIDIVKGSGNGDSYSLVLMAGPLSQRLGDRPSPNKTNVISEIEDKFKRQPHGNADVLATLATVEKAALDSARNFDRTEIYFLTDLQRSTWLPEQVTSTTVPRPKQSKDAPSKAEDKFQAALKKIQSKALLIFVDVGRDKVDNLAITDLRIEEPFITTGSEVTLRATVRNYGIKDRSQVRVELFVIKAGRTLPGQAFRPVKPLPAARWPESFPRGEERAIQHTYAFKEPGEYAVQLRLTADHLTVDDQRSFVVTVKKSIPVLLVNGKPGREPYENATDYLSKALNPTFGDPVPEALSLLTRVRPRVVTESQFATFKNEELDAYDAIFLCDVDRPTQKEVELLKYHLRRGGGVLITLGPQMAEHLGSYNATLYDKGRGLLPVRLVGVQKAPRDHYFAFDLGTAPFKDPPLKAFDSDDGRLALQGVRWRQYVRVALAPDLPVSPILTLLPGAFGANVRIDPSLPIHDPAILVWQPTTYKEVKPARGAKRPVRFEPAGLYRGRVGLITTTVNMDWTTWPASPSYLPMMHELLRLVVAGKLREQSALVGDSLEEYLQAVGQQNARVYTPDRRTEDSRTQLTRQASVWRWADTTISGIYRVTFGQDPREHLFAINVPTAGIKMHGSESDFSKPPCTARELKAVYPGWRLQVVTDLRKIDRSVKSAQEEEAAAADPEADETEIGPDVARWMLLAVLFLLILEVLLAWGFGHYSTASGTGGTRPGSARTAAIAVGSIAAVLFAFLAWVVIHAATTGELPDPVQDTIESTMSRETPKEGESNTSRLETLFVFTDSDYDAWLVGFVALAAVVLVVVVYLQEGRTAGTGFRLLLAGLRISLILLTLYVFLPRTYLKFVREEWPDLVILIDTSGSMSVTDDYQKKEVRDAAEHLTQALKADLRQRLSKLRSERDATEDVDKKRELGVQIADLTARQARLASAAGAPTRLELATALMTLQEGDWLQMLVGKKKMKVFVYHLDAGGDLARLGDLDSLDDPTRHRDLIAGIKDLKADGRVSPLGAAVHKLLDNHGAATLAALVVLTDGNTVEQTGSLKKEDLVDAAKFARDFIKKKERKKKRSRKEEPVEKGVPLYLVGIGDAHDLRDIRLDRMDAPYAVRVRDYIRFQVFLHGQKDTTVPLLLFERKADGTLVKLDEKPVKLDARGSTRQVELKHQPQEIGEKTYVVRLDVPRSRDPRQQRREEYLQVQRKVLVEEARLTRVLYIEGTPRYEFRYLKTLLERESAEDKTNKTIDLKVVLLSADDDFAKEDKSALLEIPARRELFEYDVIILGDVDPQNDKVRDRLKDLSDFVQEKGGGLLMIAGENFNPHTYKDTPLQTVMPIEPVQEPAEDTDHEEGFRPGLTTEGMNHELFRFTGDDAENLAIWNRLAEIYWWSEGYKTKPAAHVLAFHPSRPALDPRRGADDSAGKHPLVVWQLVGTGRSLFFGFDETWRWRFREFEVYYNQFWKNAIAYLARQRSERIELRLEKQTPYTRGDIIKVTVQMPEKGPPPSEVKVKWRRTPPELTGGVPRPDPPETLKLAKKEGSYGLYEGRVTRTREGKYLFELIAPETKTGPPPSAECLVVAPEGEMERLSMNRADLDQAATVSRGKFFTLGTAGDLPDRLPEAGRWELDNFRDPYNLWNIAPLFGIVVFLLGSEWILRKAKHLL